jgi:uncharacterized protein (DUF427 family)
MTSNANDNHPIRVEPRSGRTRVHRKGHLIADTAHALTLFEASYPGVRYVPRQDADMAFLKRSTYKTQCPYKGEASYFSLVTNDGAAENAVWTYESPFPVAKEIAGYLAFDPRLVEFDEQELA